MKKESILQNKNKSLKVSIKEGSASTFSNGISASYITPFALKLSSKEINIGFLSAFSGLISPIAQLFSSKLMDHFSRKKIVRTAVLLQAIMWLPLVLLAILKYFDIWQNALIYILILGYSLIAALSGISFPPWFSWMGDLVPEKERGKYFAKRNTILGTVELIAVFLGALILKSTENTTYALIGFSIIFFLSFITKLISFSILKKQYSQYPAKVKKYEQSITKIFKENKNFRNFAFYQFWLNFAIFFASPFFAVYMLNELKFDYITYMLISFSGALFYLLFNPLIGKLSDKYGNVRLFAIENIFFALNPLLWVLTGSPFWLFILPGIAAGIANSAAILSFNNFSYDYLTKKERGTGIAYASLFAGAGVFLGSIIGGLLLNFDISLFHLNKFIFIFILAFILRSAVALIFLPKIKEQKKVKRIPHLHLSILHPFKSINSEIAWARHIFK